MIDKKIEKAILEWLKTPTSYEDLRDDLLSLFKKYVMEIIGPDDKNPLPPGIVDIPTGIKVGSRNDLRAEQREKLNKI